MLWLSIGFGCFVILAWLLWFVCTASTASSCDCPYCDEEGEYEFPLRGVGHEEVIRLREKHQHVR